MMTSDEPGPSRSAFSEREAVIEVRNASFAYPNSATVIKEFSLRVEPGRVIGLVGPSGCGKSTILSLLAGLRSPTEGEIVWSDESQTEHRHPLTMLFQKDTLLPWLTAADNVDLHYRLTHSKDQTPERLHELFTMVGLGGAERAYPYELSGGMRRRTAFLTAVAPNPRVLLLDEPFSSLDEPTRVALHQDIFDIVKRMGIGVVLVTHDLAEAVSICDEVLILSARPATIVGSEEVPFGDSRNVQHLRESPQFLELYGRLWRQLTIQIEKSRAAQTAASAVVDTKRGRWGRLKSGR